MMQDMDIAFQHTPPKAGPELFVCRLKGSEMLTVTVYSPSMWGIWVHWNGSKSEPHYRSAERCPGCKARRQKRWKGYLHCYCHSMKQEILLEFTPQSAKSLADQLGTSGPLRGNRLQVKRTKGESGRLQVSVLTAVGDPAQLPEAKDPWETLRTFYGFEPRALGDDSRDIVRAGVEDFQ